MVTTIQYSFIRRLFYKPIYCGRGERAGTCKIKIISNEFQFVRYGYFLE
jgi:hypothetical protein